MDHGEHPTDALRREIQEEAGLTVVLGPLLDVLSDVRVMPDGTSLHTVRMIYRVASWTGSLRAELEGTTDAVQWFANERAGRAPAGALRRTRWWRSSCERGPRRRTPPRRHHRLGLRRPVRRQGSAPSPGAGLP